MEEKSSNDVKIWAEKKRIPTYPPQKPNFQPGERDDCSIDKIVLCTQLGRYDKAEALLSSRGFNAFEGGEGRLLSAHSWLHVLIGSESLKKGDSHSALSEFYTAKVYPSNYGEGKNKKKTTEAHVYYFLGLALESGNETPKARECFKKAIGSTFQVTDELFFEGLALRRLERVRDAQVVFLKMTEAGKAMIKNAGKPAYFGLDVTIPEPFEYDTDRINTVRGALLKGLGLRGLGRVAEAAEAFKTVRDIDPYNCKLDLYDRLFND